MGGLGGDPGCLVASSALALRDAALVCYLLSVYLIST